MYASIRAHADDSHRTLRNRGDVTDVRYELPKATYRDYPSDSSSESSEYNTEEEEPEATGAAVPARTAAEAAANTMRAAVQLAKRSRIGIGVSVKVLKR